MNRPDPKKEQAACDQWNAKYPPGTRVTVKRDSGEFQNTTTRNEAMMIGGHSAVILLEGISRTYALGRVFPCEA